MKNNELRNDVQDILHFGYPLKEGEPVGERVWNFGTPKPTAIDLPQLKNIFMESCERLLGNATDVILPLSGGLDSRLILACLLELLPPNRIHAFNYGTGGQLDFDIPPHIANATGLHFTQVSYDHISISPDDVLAFNYGVQNAPAHNIVGFTVTQKASQLALEQLGVDSDLQVWSGFLGDRVFFGKWSDNPAGMKDACIHFSDFYSINNRPKISLPEYNPASRLHQIYASATKPSHLTWLEYLDLEQRQYRVRATLGTLDNPYCFLFEQPQVLQSLHAFKGSHRKNGKLQRDYFHRFYPKLCELPVTSRFGYSFRKYETMEKLDRYARLFTHRVDGLLGTNLERFKRKKVTVRSLKKQLPGYKEVIDFGLENVIKVLGEFDIPIHPEQIEAMSFNRSRCELMSSLGYLHFQG